MHWSFKNDRLLLIGLIWNNFIGQVRSNFNPVFVFKLKHYRYAICTLPPTPNWSPCIFYSSSKSKSRS